MDFLFLVLVLLILSIVTFVMAQKRGRSGFGWFILSLIISPILCIIILACLGDTDGKRRKKLLEDEEYRHLYGKK